MKSVKVLPYVAAAVAASCGVASAATLAINPTTGNRIASERLAIEVAAVPSYSVGLPNLNFTLGSDAYRTGDTVTVTVAGGTVASASGNFACAASADGTGVSGTLAFSYTSVSGNVVTYSVARTSNAVPVYLSASTALVCSLAAGSILMVGNSLSAGTVSSVNYEPRGSGIAYDALTGSSATGGVGAVQVMWSASQFALPTTSTRNFLGQGDAGTNLAGTATISTALNSFGAGTAGNSVSIAWQTRDEVASAGLMSGALSQLAITTSALVTTTLTGDFSFLDDDSNGCTATDLTAGAGRASATGGTLTINSACTVLTITGSATTARDQDRSVRFFLNGINDARDAATSGSLTGKAINPQTIAGSVSWRDGSASTSTTYKTSAFTAATWSATAGASQTGINIPYLPYGTGISRIVYLTNKSTTASSVVTIAARNDAGTVCSSTNFAAVTVPANGVGLLTAAIDAGVQACFGATFAGKVQVDLSVSGTSTNVVTSAYNVSGNRVNVLNNTN